jgi:hypothetical protein
MVKKNFSAVLTTWKGGFKAFPGQITKAMDGL